MRIIYTKHAKKRMDRRGISESEVQSVLNYPESVERHEDGKTSYFSRVGNRFIEIVFTENKNCYIINSAIDIR